jgi:hypothetical protein
MKCQSCGHENEEGVRFCAACGQKAPENQPEAAQQQQQAPENQPAPVQPPPMQPMPEYQPAPAAAKPASALPIKKILLFAVPAVIIVLLLAIVVPNLLNCSGSSGVKDSIYFFSDGDSIIVSGNNNAKFSIDGESVRSTQRSMDGSKAVILTDYDYDDGGTLWLVTTNSYTKISDDVLAYQLSDSGSTVVYFTNYDDDDYTAELYSYDTAAKKSTRITDSAMFEGGGYMTGVCISPNGKTVAYISDYNIEKDSLAGYIKSEGKNAEKFGDNMFAAVAVSDGAKHIYYAKMNKDGGGSLHVRSGRNDNRIIADLSSSASLLLNRDYSQAIFNLDGKAYITQNGGERAKVGNSAINSIILPRGSQARSIGGDTGGVTVYGVGSFANVLVSTGDGIFFIDRQFEASKISGSAAYNGRSISKDGKSLLYITTNDNLSVIDPANPSAERKELAKKVDAFVASGDGKLIYYVNEDEELWCIKGNGTPVKISDDVAYNYLALAYNGNKVFFLVDYSYSNGGTLYYSDNGGKRVKVAGADDVSRVWATPANIFYTTVDDDVYRSNGGEKFIKFQEDATIVY